MKKSNRFNRILSLSLVLAMVISMIPATAAKAAGSTPNWNSMKWTKLTCSSDASGNAIKKIETISNCGTYNNIIVEENNTVYYTEFETGRYYIKLPSGNRTAVSSSTTPPGSVVCINPLPSTQGASYDTYLEITTAGVKLIDGACRGTYINVTCGSKDYCVYDGGGASIEFNTPVIYKASDSLFIVDLPNPHEVPSNTLNISGGASLTATNTGETIQRYYINENVTNLNDTASQTALSSEWTSARTDVANGITNSGTTAKAAITALPSVGDADKASVALTIDTLANDASNIAKVAYTGSQLERAKTMGSKIAVINEFITTASTTDNAIDSSTALTDSEKTAFKTTVNNAALKAIDSIKTAPSTDEDIASAKNKANTDLQAVIFETNKNVAKAELTNTAKAERANIDKITTLSDAEKRIRKDAIDKSLIATKDAIDTATTLDEISNLKTACLASFAAEKNIADQASDNTSSKTDQKSVTFIQDSLSDENGKIITSVNETTIIKILKGEEVWNKLDQTTKDQVNQMIKNSGGKSYETLLADAKKISKDAGNVGSNYDVGTIPFYASDVSTKATALKWEKVNGADGYLVYSNVCAANEKKNKPKLVKNVTSGSITECTIAKRKKNKWYKYRVVAYKIINNKKTPVSKSMLIHVCNSNKDYKYANPKEITVNKKSLTLKTNKTATIKSKVVIPKSKALKKHGAQVRYIVSDSRIASVSKKGKIKAKKAGTCTIYVCAQNGVYKTIKVTVK